MLAQAFSTSDFFILTLGGNPTCHLYDSRNSLLSAVGGGVPLAVADNDQPDREGQRSPDDGADGAVVGDLFPGETVKSEQIHDVGRKAQGEERVIHIVE